MKLAENESIIDKYQFSPNDDHSHTCILTSNRLSVKYKHNEKLIEFVDNINAQLK